MAKEPWLLILSLGFEERCLGVPYSLQKYNDTNNLNVYCIEQANSNVGPLAVYRRELHKKTLTSLFPNVRYLSPDDANDEARSFRQNFPKSRVAIDASCIPRRQFFSLLKTLFEVSLKEHPLKSSVHYCQPHSYVPGDHELPYPSSRTLYEHPGVAKSSSNLLVFPGFDASATAIAISKVFPFESSNSPGNVRLAFCYPGSDITFYERALCAHRDLLSGNFQSFNIDHATTHMVDAADIARCILSFAQSNGMTKNLFVANAGPRILIPSIFSAIWRLRELKFNCNILQTEPLAYRSVRSEGIGKLFRMDLDKVLDAVDTQAISIIDNPK